VLFFSPRLGLEGRFAVAEMNGRMRIIGLTVGYVALSDGDLFDGLSMEEAVPQLPLAAMMREAVAAAAEKMAAGSVENAGQLALMGLHRRRKAEERRQDRYHLDLVAFHYRNEMRAAEAEGRKPTPLEAVHVHFPEKSERTIARWISQCREPSVGLLPPTSRGRPLA